MNVKELREKDVDSLKKEVTELYRAGFSLRMQHATQQLNNSSQLRKNRQEVARAKTILREKAGK